MEPKNISESLEEESWVDANAIRIDEEEWLSETQLDWLLKGHQARGRKNYDEMDVKSAFLYGKIDEEVYVSQPQGFQDPKSTKKSWVMSFEAVMKSRISDDSMREPLLSWPTSLKTEPDGIFISQDKYVAEILKKFDFASYQVTPKTTHLSAGQTNFRYLKGKPKLGLWNPRESSFDLNPNSDSELCWRQILTGNPQQEKPKYAAASCCGQVLWIQNQMLDYGFNFMNTKIYIDNESTICIVKNPVYHSKTKHIAIRHHFIRDAYEKKLIQFKSKKIAQVVRAWIQSKNSLVKHFEDMRLYRPFKEYLQVWFNPPRDVSMSCLTTKGMRNNGAMCARRFRESLRRVTDGAEAFLILTLFILCLDKVSTDHAKLVPLGKVCTAKETLEKNTAKGTKCKLEPLISLTDDLSLLSNMAALESCPKHNMIAYLEKTEGNVEFHEVIDFLRRSYIYHALTVSPVVSTTFVEQFWTSAKSKTINNVRHITAKVAGKFVSISEASIRTDLIFDDADGIDSLPNQAIFDAIQLMGYEGDLTVLTFNKALFSPQWRRRNSFSDIFFVYDDFHNPRFQSDFTDHSQKHRMNLSITFSPRSGSSSHHEFAGEPLTIPVRNVVIINEPTQEEIDILLVPVNYSTVVVDADSKI
ncbi:hypothetical protein Tco_0060310 [Tanacetum coccineum]